MPPIFCNQPSLPIMQTLSYISTTTLLTCCAYERGVSLVVKQAWFDFTGQTFLHDLSAAYNKAGVG